MTDKELIFAIHTYTEKERFLQKHRNMENLVEFLQNKPFESNQLFDILHNYPTPDPETVHDSSNTFSSYAKSGIGGQIVVSQHDRFSPACPHSHDYYEIQYVYEGEFTQTIHNASLHMQTGDVCIIPPNVNHSVDIQNYSILINIIVENDMFHDIFLNKITGDNILSTFFLNSVYSPNINNYVVFHTTGDTQIQDVILQMCLEFINREIYFEQLLTTELLRFFGYVLRYYSTTAQMPIIKSQKDLVDFAMIKYIQDNYKTVSLSELATKYHYSEQQTSARIKALCGYSFSQYLTNYRMTIAKHLLKDTNMKIHTIAEEAGYQSQEHFIRTFKTHYGMTPSNYRKQE